MAIFISLKNLWFFEEFVFESNDCFAWRYFHIVPPGKYIPTFTSRMYTWLWKFYKLLQNVNFLSSFDVQLNFHFYLLKSFSLTSLYSELPNACSKVILFSETHWDTLNFEVIFRDVPPVYFLITMHVFELF